MPAVLQRRLSPTILPISVLHGYLTAVNYGPATDSDAALALGMKHVQSVAGRPGVQSLWFLGCFGAVILVSYGICSQEWRLLVRPPACEIKHAFINLPNGFLVVEAWGFSFRVLGSNCP